MLLCDVMWMHDKEVHLHGHHNVFHLSHCIIVHIRAHDFKQIYIIRMEQHHSNIMRKANVHVSHL